MRGFFFKKGDDDIEDDRSVRLQAIGVRLAINAAGLWAAAELLEGIEIEGWRALVGAAFILGAVNTFVRPVAKAVACPLSCLTFGLFALVINAAMLLLTDWIAGFFDLAVRIDGFWTAVLGALIISIVGVVLSTLVGRPLLRALRRRRSDEEE